MVQQYREAQPTRCLAGNRAICSCVTSLVTRLAAACRNTAGQGERSPKFLTPAFDPGLPIKLLYLAGDDAAFLVSDQRTASRMSSFALMTLSFSLIRAQ